MKRNWYKFRVKYSKEMDDGNRKKVSEEYLVDAESFTEPEKRANKAATDLIGTRDFDITAISREPVSDIIKGTEAEENHWYKAVVALVTEDDETGQKSSRLKSCTSMQKTLRRLMCCFVNVWKTVRWTGKSSLLLRPRCLACWSTSKFDKRNNSKTYSI